MRHVILRKSLKQSDNDLKNVLKKVLDKNNRKMLYCESCYSKQRTTFAL